MGSSNTTSATVTASSGSGQKLTTASKIEEDDFDSLFKLIEIDNYNGFKLKALEDKRLPTELALNGGEIDEQQFSAMTIAKPDWENEKKMQADMTIAEQNCKNESTMQADMTIAEQNWENEKKMQESLAILLKQKLDNVSTTELLNPVNPVNTKKRKNSSENRPSTVEATNVVSVETVDQPTNQASCEACLRTIFTNYKKFLSRKFKARAWKDYPADPRGCLVTASSRQDLACLNTESSILFQGECKNGYRYEHMDGVRQCAGYLYHQLWWFRTIQGIDVRKVYGFAVSGPKCQKVGQNKAVLSLLVLCAPDEGIGSRLKLYNFQQVFYNCQQLFLLLGKFVQSDWRVNSNDLSEIPSDGHWPGCMMIPPSLLAGDRDGSCWEIVPNGTAALVIRLRVTKYNRGEVMEFLKKFCCQEQKDLLECLDIDQAGSAAAAAATTNAGAGESFFYLKMKTYASGADWADTGAFTNALSKSTNGQAGNKKLDTWRNTYAMKYILNSDCNLLIVMNDMGCVLNENNKPEYPDFCKQFQQLMEEVLHIQEELRLVHGDIHCGNLLYKEKPSSGECELRLIDWDEAAKRPRERIALGSEQKELYPEAFLKNPEAYTKTQLLILFRDVSRGLYGERKVWFGGDQKIGDTAEKVNGQYEDLGEFLSNKGGHANMPS